MGNSVTLLSNQTHPGDSAVKTVRGDKQKGDGYYSRGDGFHTVQITVTGFIGKIEIEGTLGHDPKDPFYTNSNDSTDWSPVTVNGSPYSLEYTTSTTATVVQNFTGNYTWLRVFVSDWTDGTVNSIKLNH